jgi:Tfp pilus assembly protein PilF
MPKKRRVERVRAAKRPVTAVSAVLTANAPIRSINVEEFARRLKKEASAEKRFALFLGAGCSVSSGIPAAGALVQDHWLPRLRDYQAPLRSDLDVWAREVIDDYDPAKPSLSYGKLIDKLFITAEDRQREIEDLCEGRTPSFGYAVLAQLVALEQGPFNVVLTTNFDDLLSDALYLYTDARPLVIYHESLAAFIRPTRTRPLIVKLHGDHRLSPRNTVLETEVLEREIQRHTAMVLHDRGLIFMGYGGADIGILTMLNDLPPEALPFGAYWVHPEEPSGSVREWLARRHGVWVRSGWFDEVMLILRNLFLLPHPSPERFTLIFQEYQQKFQELSAAIKEKPAEASGIEALNLALTKTEELLPDYWRVVSRALRLQTGDPDRAENVYQQGIKEFPKAAPLLGNYAVFLKDVRKDNDRAEAMYRRALEADPKHASILGNYANFLKNMRKDYAAAEAMYRRALEADPKHPFNLSNYALFLKNVRKDNDGAEAMYRRALEADPKHASILGNYANFLTNVRKDNDAAETMYRRALEADPENANNRANMAGFLLAKGDIGGLLVLHETAELLRQNPSPITEIECAFYSFAHERPEQRVAALRAVRRLVESGVRSRSWDLSRNVERAQLNGHSEGSWLSKLAAVVNGAAQPDVLKDWSAWNNAVS